MAKFLIGFLLLTSVAASDESCTTGACADGSEVAEMEVSMLQRRKGGKDIDTSLTKRREEILREIEEIDKELAKTEEKPGEAWLNADAHHGSHALYVTTIHGFDVGAEILIGSDPIAYKIKDKGSVHGLGLSLSVEEALRQDYYANTVVFVKPEEADATLTVEAHKGSHALYVDHNHNFHIGERITIGENEHTVKRKGFDHLLGLSLTLEEGLTATYPEGTPVFNQDGFDNHDTCKKAGEVCGKFFIQEGSCCEGSFCSEPDPTGDAGTKTCMAIGGAVAGGR